MHPTDPADLVREHQEEIQRRRALAEAEHVQDTFENAANVCSVPAKNPDQMHIVFSLSNEKFAPRMRPGESPAVRLYGAFATREEARSYAGDLAAYDPGISLLVDEVHKWILAPRNESRLNDASIVDKKLKRHDVRKQRDHDEFVARQGKSVDVEGLSPDKKDDDSVAKRAQGDGVGGRHAVPALYQMADQRLAVVSFVCDDSNEFLFKVYGFVDSQTDANSWVRNVLSKSVKDYHIDVVSSCQWCFPTTMKAERVDAEAFRNKELDAIMNHHKKEPERVKEFSDWYATTQEGTPSNCIEEVEADISSSEDGERRRDGSGGASGDAE